MARAMGMMVAVAMAMAMVEGGAVKTLMLTLEGNDARSSPRSSSCPGFVGIQPSWLLVGRTGSVCELSCGRRSWNAGAMGEDKMQTKLCRMMSSVGTSTDGKGTSFFEEEDENMGEEFFRDEDISKERVMQMTVAELKEQLKDRGFK
eukprot:26081-Hanusia_phi.AAC.1